MTQPRRQTRILPAAEESALDTAAGVLAKGGLVAFPTDTVYGLGCDMWSPEAIRGLYEAKDRPREMAIPVLVSEPDHLARVAQADESAYAPLIARFWPGPLTLVLPRRPQVPDELTSGLNSVAVRMPDHPVALALIARAGGTLAVTSANLSGQPATRSAEQVHRELSGRIDLVLDGGTTPVGVPSSIVNLCDHPPRLLREGSLTLTVLRDVLPNLRPA